MSRNILNLPVVNALLDLSTQPRRYENRSQIATAAEMTESTLSMIASGKRGGVSGVTDDTVVRLASALGISTAALVVPESGDDRIDLLEAELAHVAQEHARIRKELGRLRKRNTTE